MDLLYLPSCLYIHCGFAVAKLSSCISKTEQESSLLRCASKARDPVLTALACLD